MERRWAGLPGRSFYLRPLLWLFCSCSYYFDKYHQQEKFRTGLRIALGALTLVYGFWTVRQVGIWKNGITLWSHVIKFEADNNSLPYWNRGQYYRNEIGDYECRADRLQQGRGY